MQVNYCDLCDSPLKKERHIVVIVKDVDLTNTNTNYTHKERRTYEVCDSCMRLFDSIFEYKKDKINEIIDWIDTTYNTGDKNNEDS